MRNRGIRAGIGAILVLFLAGCNTIPLRNQALSHFEEGAGYRYKNIACGEDNSDSLLVILTFSGGGTRAAALAYGVLEKLRDTPIHWEGGKRRLLDEVDIISSVSGGSLPAAYYGLFGDRIFEEFPDKALYKSIQNALIAEVLSPLNWPKLVSPFYGRTDMLADDFSREIFENKTFADLLARNRRPFILLNATDAELGSRFDFTQRQFDLLYSDLSSYPVGNAVAASAAFPGLLTPITLTNYPSGETYAPPRWIARELDEPNVDSPRYRDALLAQAYVNKERPYVYLCDGGVSDNLGLAPILQMLNGSFPGDDVNRLFKNDAVKKIVVITVNAKRINRVEGSVKGKILGPFKVFGIATSAPLAHYTDAQLTLMRTFIREERQKQELRQRLIDAYGDDALTAYFPELAGAVTAYHFIEVDFERVPDGATRDFLNQIPTAFKLKREQVDTLRDAAGAILDANPEFEKLLEELK